MICIRIADVSEHAAASNEFVHITLLTIANVRSHLVLEVSL